MPGEEINNSMPFISIISGKIRQRVEESTPGAVRRDYELKDGTKGFKYELSYSSWRGTIIKIVFKDTKYGEMMNVYFDDAILSINTESRYFNDFARKIFSADISDEIIVAPYDFEPQGKKKTGLNLYQGRIAKECKLQDYFYDPIKKKSINGMPEPEGDTKAYSKSDWKMYFMLVRKFLISKLKELEFSEVAPQEKEEQDNSEIKDSEIVGKKDEVSLADIPFD